MSEQVNSMTDAEPSDTSAAAAEENFVVKKRSLSLSASFPNWLRRRSDNVGSKTQPLAKKMLKNQRNVWTIDISPL